MNDYVLSCCSTADLTAEHLRERDIRILCFHFSLDGVDMEDDLGKTIPFPEFYKRIRTAKIIRTSQPSAGEFVSYFRPMLEQGKDVFHVSLSTGLSGEMNSAWAASELLKEEFPSRRIEIVDSLGASMGYGLLMDELADQRDAGASLSELTDFCHRQRLKIQHWFFSTDLSFYFRGGRISRTAFLAGQLISICPLLHVDEKGRLIPVRKIRTKKKVIEKMLQKMEEYAENGLDYSGKCYISHSDCYEDARALADLIEEKFAKLREKIRINYVGTTIGAHTGPGTVALFFDGKDRSFGL